MIAFSIGSVSVYRYGIMYAVSFLLGYGLLIWGQKAGRYSQYPFLDKLIKNDVDNILIAILLGVMIVGRLGHVLIYDFAYFVENPSAVFAYNQGGMSFIGGIVGTIISLASFLFLFYKKELADSFFSKLFSVLDVIMPLLPLGIFFGRFGNFLNQELYGIVVSKARGLSDSIISLGQNLGVFYIYNSVGPELRVNTNMLSMLFEGAMIAGIIWYVFLNYWKDKKINSGQLSALWLGSYSVVRFVLEYVRQDSQAEFVGWFSKSQWFFLLFMSVAIVVWFVRKKRR